MSAQFTKDMPATLMPIALSGKIPMTSFVSFSQALKAFDANAKAADKAMAAAEAAGDVATMQKLAAQEQAARDAFYMPNGLSFNPYYHSLDRVFTSFPELVFAVSDAKAQQAALDRFTRALQNAAAALK
jgi:hypothetical protein